MIVRYSIFHGFAILCVSLLSLHSAAVFAGTTVSCPFGAGGGGDSTDRGFYVQNYSGSSLGLVTLQYSVFSTPGPYTIQLQARIGSYAGAIVGTASATAVLPTGPSINPVTFNFGNAPVTPGATLTFAQTVTSPVSGAMIDYNTGVSPCTNVTETEGTNPPLDTFRRNTVGVTITDGAPSIPVAATLPSLSPAALALLGVLLVGVTMWILRRQRVR